jgi:hypothetical protein
MQNTRQDMQHTVDIMGIDGKMSLAKNVKILNIANSGDSVMINKKLNIGSEYILRFKSKKNISEVKGLVVWSKRSEAILLVYSM